jgi:lysophospholipase L1-like esterase
MSDQHRSRRLKVKNWLANLLLIAASVVVTVIGLELLIAFLAPQQVRMATTPGSFYLRYDANLGWVNREGATGEVTAAKGISPFKVRVNTQGFRGPEVKIPKPPGVRRIAFLGDSNTFGFGIGEGERFTDLLAKRVPAGTEILNLGVFGYGTDQEAIYLERQALRFAPDRVILVVSAGDLSDVMSSVNAGAAKPYCRIIAGKFSINNIPVPPSTPLMSSRSLASRFKVFLYKHSHLYRLAQSRVLALNRYMTDTVQEMDEREGFAVMVEVIKGMQRVCREGGGDFKVLLVSHGEWIDGLRRDSSRPVGYYVPLKAALQAEGVAVIDPTDAFVKWHGEPLFFPQDAVHLTAAGNRLIAETVGRQLVQ